MKVKYIVIIVLSGILIGLLLISYGSSTTLTITDVQVRSTPLK